MNKLGGVTKRIQSIPIKELNPQSLKLLQIGLEVTIDRLIKVYNDSGDKINSPCKIIKNECAEQSKSV